MSTKLKKSITTHSSHQGAASSEGSKTNKKTTSSDLGSALIRNQLAAQQRTRKSGLIPGRAYVLTKNIAPFKAGEQFVCGSSADKHDLQFALNRLSDGPSPDDGTWRELASHVQEIAHTPATLAVLRKVDEDWAEDDNGERMSVPKKVTQKQFKEALKTVRKPPEDPNDLVSAVRTLVLVYGSNGKAVKDAILHAVFSNCDHHTWIEFIRPGLELDLEDAIFGETLELARSSAALNDLVNGERRHGRSIMYLLDQSARCYAEGFADAYPDR